MKKLAINLIIASLLILMSISTQALPRPFTSNAYSNSIVRSQFLEKLESPSDNILNFAEEEAYVHFTINSMNEIVIINTGTCNPELDVFLRRALNYERIDAKNILIDEDYYIKVTFHKSDRSQTLL